MSKPRKPSQVRLHDLATDQYADFFAQLAEKKRGSTRDGKPFYICKFRDARRTISTVPIWADGQHFEDCQTHWQPGQFYKVRGTVVENEKYGAQLEIEQIRLVEDRDRAEGYTELDFVERTRFDPDQMFVELDAIVAGEVKDPPLRQLVQMLLQTHADTLKMLPATTNKFYPFAGGWLEHTLSVTRNCVWLADQYIAQFPDLAPPLNRDLVIAGAVLHDIGRLREIEATPPGQPSRLAIDGELFGPVLLGVEIVRDAVRGVPELNPELVRLLEHILYAHLTRPEWGSPRLPCIPEVLIVHHADDLDAKFEMYARCLTKDTAAGPFTDPDPILKRPLLKGRGV